jgi:glutathione S-transferase
MSAADILYDVPVSNHGARVRMILYSKKLSEAQVQIVSPTVIGGMKSPEFLALNLVGKIPLLVLADTGLAVPESDTISRYLLDKYSAVGPSFVPNTIEQRVLSEEISRTHDMYVSLVQGAMYKAPGTPYSIYGQDRKAALSELRRQFGRIETMLAQFYEKYPHHAGGKYLCGEQISLADATLFPTAIFAMFMLPQFFEWKESDVLGPRLTEWFNFMGKEEPEGVKIKGEIETALEGWKASGRWDPIIAEMSLTYH